MYGEKEAEMSVSAGEVSLEVNLRNRAEEAFVLSRVNLFAVDKLGLCNKFCTVYAGASSNIRELARHCCNVCFEKRRPLKIDDQKLRYCERVILKEPLIIYVNTCKPRPCLNSV